MSDQNATKTINLQATFNKMATKGEVGDIKIVPQKIKCSNTVVKARRIFEDNNPEFKFSVKAQSKKGLKGITIITRLQ